MRILHCISSMSGGGAERQLAYLARELGGLGWEVHVALTRRGENWNRLQHSSAVVHEVPTRSAYDARLFGSLRRIVADVKPDIIQTWLLQMEMLGGLAAIAQRRPWVFCERASEGVYPRSLKNVSRRIIARFASAIVSNSAAGDRYWRDRLGDRTRRYVIRNGIPLAEIAAAPAETGEEIGLGPRDPLVLFAGRLEPEKNIATLLDALELILTRHDQIRVVLCGRGSLRPAVARWIDTHRLVGRVIIIGYTPRLWGWMKRANVFVSSSLAEGSPNVVLEAMACGVPLVASDIPEHRELVDESAAVLVKPTSAARLAEAVEGVLRDPGPAAARARAARDRAAHHGLQAVAERYHQMYREILASDEAC
jgi:glycosyltransferase involved in cell wall biosynthesis